MIPKFGRRLSRPGRPRTIREYMIWMRGYSQGSMRMIKLMEGIARGAVKVSDMLAPQQKSEVELMSEDGTLEFLTVNQQNDPIAALRTWALEPDADLDQMVAFVYDGRHYERTTLHVDVVTGNVSGQYAPSGKIWNPHSGEWVLP